MVHPNILCAQATNDASAVTLLGSNTAVRSGEFLRPANSLSKEPGDGPDAQPGRRSRLHREPIFHSSRGIVRFDVVLCQREECHHHRYWRSCGFGGLPSPLGGNHNVRANGPVRIGYGHADRHDHRPLSGLS